MAYMPGYSRDKAPRIGIFFNSIGAFNERGKRETEDAWRKLFADFQEGGIIARNSLLVENRVFGPHEVMSVADEFARRLVDAILIVNSAFPNGNAFTTIAMYPYLVRIPIMVAADREAVIPGCREWTTNAWCGVIMNNFAAKRLGRYMHPLAGSPSDPSFRDELKMLLNCFRAVAHMRRDYMGRFGDNPAGFHSAQGDELAYTSIFGTRMGRVDLMAVMNTFKERRTQGLLGEASFDEEDVAATAERMKDGKGFAGTPEMLDAAARLYHAFRAHIEAEGFTSATFKCWPELQSAYFPYTPCAAMGQLLADRLVTGAGCEGDIPATVAQSLGTLLTGKPAAMLDFVDHIGSSEVVRLGHCGVGIPGLMEEGDSLGLSSPCRQCGVTTGLDHIGQFKYGVKTGIGLIPHKDSFKMLVFTGESSKETDKNILYSAADVRVADHKRLNDLILEHGFSHHLAVAMGDVSKELKVLCGYYGIECILL